MVLMHFEDKNTFSGVPIKLHFHANCALLAHHVMK